MVYYKDLSSESIKHLLGHYGIRLHCLQFDMDIPYSFWGEPEAGRLGENLYLRDDTPIHSILHESAHYVCMPEQQRHNAEVDAKGSAMEENATCYLQVLLSNHIHGYSRKQLMKDMDDWGYSFRFGSTHDWFTKDAKEVKDWLISHNLITDRNEVTWQLRA